MVLTCTEAGATQLIWASVEFEAITYANTDQEGTIVNRMGVNTFTANLTEVSVLRMTSTLMFSFTDSLDGLTVDCLTVVGGLIIRMATVENTGTREHYCMCILVSASCIL